MLWIHVFVSLQIHEAYEPMNFVVQSVAMGIVSDLMVNIV